MQKKIIALAVAGLVSGVAYAQTNVTVYGVIDQNYTYSKSDTGLAGGGNYKFSGLRDGTSTGLNGSRFGFFGEEALGNGLSAIFRMEYGREQDENGAQTLAIRQSFVGFKNQYGTVTAGRHYNAASDIYGGFSSNGVVSVMPLNVLQGQNQSQVRSQGGNARQDNLVKYTSPNWSGFTLGASYAFGEVNRTTSTAFDPRAKVTDNGRLTLAGKYDNGPFAVGLAYGLVNNFRSAAATVPDQQGKDINEWYLGASYDFSMVKLFATYQNYKDKSDVVAVATKQKLWSLGASVPVGAKGKVMFEYAKVNFKQDNQLPGVERDDGASKGWGLGYQYDLSKRTALYTFVSQIKHDDNTFPVGTGWGGVNNTWAAGEKQSNFVVGVRHMF